MRHAALVVAATLMLMPADVPAAPVGLRVAIYSGTGAESDKTLALYRAVASAGHEPMAITRNDVLGGRLTRSSFDVLVLPAGEDGKRCCAGHYSDDGDALGSIGAQNAIRAYVTGGGGMVGIEAGAYFMAKNGGTLDVYGANYTNVTNAVGKRTLTISDAAFGSGTLESWHSYGGGWISSTPTSRTLAKNAAGQAAIVRDAFGAGRVVLCSFDLELRGDSDLDWTAWDNWAMGGHASSDRNWVLLGRLIGWAATGDSSAPTIVASNPPGARVAVVATHSTDGGAYPGLLPAVGRAIEAAGHVPLAVRFAEIKASRLTLANFGTVVFPGGYAYGYKTGLAGNEAKVRSFVSSGGGYLGICAGGFYAPGTIVWEGKAYAYPLNIYKGQAIGAIADITPWPNYTLTPVRVDDPLIGPWVGEQTYYGGGHYTIPTDAQQGAHVTVAGTYDYAGVSRGRADIVRYPFGSGHVALVGTHPESRAGSTQDWLYWDGWDENDQPLSNPSDPWIVLDRLLDDWLTPP